MCTMRVWGRQRDFLCPQVHETPAGPVVTCDSFNNSTYRDHCGQTPVNQHLINTKAYACLVCILQCLQKHLNPSSAATPFLFPHQSCSLILCNVLVNKYNPKHTYKPDNSTTRQAVIIYLDKHYKHIRKRTHVFTDFEWPERSAMSSYMLMLKPSDPTSIGL